MIVTKLQPADGHWSPTRMRCWAAEVPGMGLTAEQQPRLGCCLAGRHWSRRHGLPCRVGACGVPAAHHRGHPAQQPGGERAGGRQGHLRGQPHRRARRGGHLCPRGARHGQRARHAGPLTCASADDPSSTESQPEAGCGSRLAPGASRAGQQARQAGALVCASAPPTGGGGGGVVIAKPDAAAIPCTHGAGMRCNVRCWYTLPQMCAPWQDTMVGQHSMHKCSTGPASAVQRQQETAAIGSRPCAISSKASCQQPSWPVLQACRQAKHTHTRSAAGQRQAGAGVDQGITGPKFLGAREMTYRLAFIASSTQAGFPHEPVFPGLFHPGGSPQEPSPCHGWSHSRTSLHSNEAPGHCCKAAVASVPSSSQPPAFRSDLPGLRG